MIARVLDLYRASGADLPFGDPVAPHGVGMEGYFWRFTDFAARRVVIVLCGVCPGWSLVAVAASDGFLEWAVVDDFAPVPGRDLRLRLPRATVDCSIEELHGWGRRMFGGLGPAHAVPGLGQYWHPHLLLGRASGSALLDGVPINLDGAAVYAEKNWGSTFAGHWWWGQTHFPDSDACLSFAGGRMFGLSPTSIVFASGGSVTRWVPPLALVSVDTAPGEWRLRAFDGRQRIEVSGEADPASAHLLPVPVPSERRAELRSRQHLAGHLTVTVSRARRTLFRGESALAGLERGTP